MYVISRRIGFYILTAIAAVTVIFFIPRVMPGNPVSAVLAKMQGTVVTKQTLLAFMNGAMPQVALEYGRKTISAYERPTIDEVEQATLGGGEAKEAA